MKTNATSQDSPSENEISAGSSPKRRLEGRMNTADLVFTVLAFNAPLAVFVGFVPVVIGFGNGLGAPVTYLGAGALILLFAIGFMAMARRLPNPGAYYAYITAGLGRPLGLGAAILAIFAYFFILLGSYAFGGIAIQPLVQNVFHGPDIQWWVWVLALILFTGILGYFRISLSARILTIAMCLETVIVLVWNAVVLGQGGAEGVSAVSFRPDSVLSGAIGLAVLFGVTCFGGFESTAVFREETRDPEKTVPRATYIAIAGMAVIYAVSSFSLITAYGPSKVVEATAADPTGSVLSSFDVYLGNVALDLVNVLLCCSIFAAVLATHNVATRYVYSLSVDGVLPTKLGDVHHRHGSPHRASLLVSIMSLVGFSIVLAVGTAPATLYATLVGVGGYALLSLMLLTACAIIRYFSMRRRAGEFHSIWKTIVAPILACAGLLVAVFLATENIALMLGSSQEMANIMLIISWGLVAIGVVYALILRRKRPAVYATIGRQDL